MMKNIIRVVLKTIHADLKAARAGSLAAVVGSSTAGVAGLRIATAMVRATATTFSVSGL